MARANSLGGSAMTHNKPSRFSWLTGILCAIWALAVLLLIVDSLDMLDMIGRARVRANSAALWFTLWLDLWALGGAAILAVVYLNPGHRAGKQRILWGGLALGLLVGRPFVGGLGWFVGALHPLLDLALFALAPPLMSITTMVVIVITGLGILATCAVIVGVPITLVNQLFMFENYLRIYKYHEAGLAGYLIRFNYWLKGETMPPAAPDESKGARFATAQEVQGLNARDDGSGFGFGHIEG